VHKELVANKKILFSESLIPVAEIAQMPFRPKRFRFEESKEFLMSQGKNIEDFYYERFSPFSWFVYYRNFVVINIPAFNVQTLKDMNIAQAIDFETARLQSCLEKRHYESFFNLIDKRVALEAYLKLFPIIPDEEKYRLFWYNFSRLRLGLEDFKPEFINLIQKYKLPIKLPIDEQGYIEIFRGHKGTNSVSMSSSWTQDINTAIYYAHQIHAGGKVFRGKIHQEKVLASIKYRNEKEVICFPGEVKNIEEVKFINISELMPQLKKARVIDYYERYSALLRDIYFYKPCGIHGLSHTRRVLLLCLILAWMENLDKKDWDLLSLAAIYHDIGRTNDNFDPQHGRESFNKAESLKLITPELKEHEMLRFIIENHCISDHHAALSINEYRVNDPKHLLTLYKIFKDADGLDRIRINDLDVKQLRTSSAPKLLLIARELLEKIC